MTTLPTLALSIRQPWAHAIVHLGKRLENRDWSAANPAMKFRGPVCIHTGSGMTRTEYNEARDFMSSIGVACPPPHRLQRGGIIGTAEVADIIKDSADPWFMGPRALVLQNVQPVSFIGCAGQLGFFEWKANGLSPVPLNPWMQPAGGPAPPKGNVAVEQQGDLL
jgi:hypothetical protein